MAIEVGMILEGKVSGITKFGAFVDLPDSQTGMVHISEVAHTYINEIGDYVKVGQTVKVKVLALNNGKISLSMKQAVPQERKPRNNDRGDRPERGDRNNRRQGTPPLLAQAACRSARMRLFAATPPATASRP